MKMKKFFGVILLFFALIVSSCSEGEVVDQSFVNTGDGELINVKLNLVGDILESGNLATRNGESNDLFGIRILSAPINGEEQYTFYAAGLFDDVELAMDLTLFTDHKYYIQATLIKNGKNVIAYETEDGEMFGALYLTPFEMRFTNMLSYTNNYLGDLSYSSIYYADWGELLDIDRYYGEVIDFIPTSNNDVTLSLKRTSARLVFNVNKLKGTLTAWCGDMRVFMHENPDEENFQITKIFSLSGNYGHYSAEWFANPVNNYPVKVVWDRLDGSSVILMDETVTLQANKTKTFDFDLSSYYGSGPGIEIPDEDDWG